MLLQVVQAIIIHTFLLICSIISVLEWAVIAMTPFPQTSPVTFFHPAAVARDWRNRYVSCRQRMNRSSWPLMGSRNSKLRMMLSFSARRVLLRITSNNNNAPPGQMANTKVQIEEWIMTSFLPYDFLNKLRLDHPLPWIQLMIRACPQGHTTYYNQYRPRRYISITMNPLCLLCTHCPR
jgi:hypothetical protein